MITTCFFETLNNLFQELREKMDDTIVQIQKRDDISPDVFKEIESIKGITKQYYDQHDTMLKELIRVMGEWKKMLVLEIKNRLPDKTNQIIDRIDKLNNGISELEKPVIIREKWITALNRNRKLCLFFFIAGMLFLGSIFGNIRQYSDNRQLKKSDWKYRYMKMEYPKRVDLPFLLDSIFENSPKLKTEICDSITSL